MTQAQSSAQTRSQQLATRRALGFIALSALLPGSVQTYTGRAGMGRTALRVWLTIWTLALLLLGALLLFRGPAIALLLNPTFLGFAGVLLFCVSLGWVALLFDSWRRAQPWRQTTAGRVAGAVLVVVLSGIMLGASALTASALTALRDVSTIFGGTGTPAAEDAERLNVLLLGGDSGPTREGLRPDSIMVASIDAETGRTVLISLPRNLEGAPFPESNPLHELYPSGYDCPESACMLNGIYTLAHEHADLFEGDEDPGLRSMQDVVGNILGLQINYYALIDLAGFEALIDAVGGITLDIGRRIPIGGGSWPITGWIEPGEDQHLDGYHALWFARSREGSSDYDRMARQKCVLNAMAKQLDPYTLATSFSELAAAGSGLIETSVSAADVSELIDLALKAKDLPIASVSFAPPLIEVGVPNYPFIRQHTAEAIAESEQLDTAEAANPTPSTPEASQPAATTPPASAPASPSVSGSPSVSASPNGTAAAGEPPASAAPSTPQQETDDLAAVCSVSG